MGLGMARSLLRAGLDVAGCDVGAAAVERFVAAGGRGAATPAEVAKDADFVVSVVVNAAQTEAILFGPSGVAETLPEGAVFISSAPWTRKSRASSPRGSKPPGASISTLPFPAVPSGRGRRAHHSRLRQPRRLRQGEAGPRCHGRQALCPWRCRRTGRGVKMINQLLAGVHIAAASEAMAFAARQGLDLRKVYEVITASAGNSWMFENRMPHVLDGDYTPRSAVDIFVKDLGISRTWPAARSSGAGLRRRAPDVPCHLSGRHGRG